MLLPARERSSQNRTGHGWRIEEEAHKNLIFPHIYNRSKNNLFGIFNKKRIFLKILLKKKNGFKNWVIFRGRGGHSDGGSEATLPRIEDHANQAADRPPLLGT